MVMQAEAAFLWGVSVSMRVKRSKVSIPQTPTQVSCFDRTGRYQSARLESRWLSGHPVRSLGVPVLPRRHLDNQLKPRPPLPVFAPDTWSQDCRPLLSMFDMGLHLKWVDEGCERSQNGAFLWPLGLAKHLERVRKDYLY